MSLPDRYHALLLLERESAKKRASERASKRERERERVRERDVQNPDENGHNISQVEA